MAAQMCRKSLSDQSESDVEEELLLLLIVQRRRLRRQKRRWVHSILMGREKYGEYHTLVQELRLHSDRFYRYFRMSVDQFTELLSIIGPRIKKNDTNYRKAISAEQRLAICLKFLASGDTYTTIAFSYRFGISTVSTIVEETCEFLWICLQERCMPIPTKDLWLNISNRFQRNWNFPNCIGAIDGKHVVIQAPPNSGSMFYNYKGTFSIVLLALVDADYKFVVIDVGSYGSSSDAGIYSHSPLGRMLDTGTLHVPAAVELPGAVERGPLPYVTVGDEAFPLKNYLLRPYPGKHLPEDKLVFNYRLSRARRISENAFGILTQRWRVCQRRIQLNPERVVAVVKATCILHNFLHKSKELQEGDLPNLDEHGLPDIIGADGLQDITCFGGNRPTAEAIAIRDAYKAYFSSPAGEVPWQYAVVRRGRPNMS